MRHRGRTPWILAVALVSMVALPATRSLAADVDPWAPGAQWLTMRAGVAKSWVDGSGDAGFGYGFGSSYMLSKWKVLKRFSLGGYIYHDQVGKFGRASQVQVPVTLELVRHLGGTSLHPYVGFGGGPFYRKTYRTGDEIRNVEPGFYLTLGANVPVGGRHLIGLDVRFVRVDQSNVPPNPVFGLGSADENTDGSIQRGAGSQWSIKIGYSLAQ